MLNLNTEQKEKIEEAANILKSVEDEYLADVYRLVPVMKLLGSLNARANQAEISRLRHLGARSIHNAKIAGSLAQDLFELIEEE